MLVPAWATAGASKRQSLPSVSPSLWWTESEGRLEMLLSSECPSCVLQWMCPSLPHHSLMSSATVLFWVGCESRFVLGLSVPFSVWVSLYLSKPADSEKNRSKESNGWRIPHASQLWTLRIGMWTFRRGMSQRSSVLACKIIHLCCGTWDLVPWTGIKPGPLHWKHRVLATELPGKPTEVLRFH